MQCFIGKCRHTGGVFSFLKIFEPSRDPYTKLRSIVEPQFVGNPDDRVQEK